MALTLALAAASGAAHACMVPASFQAEDVRYAEVVVVGRIANYKLVLDPKARRERADMLARSPKMAPELRKSLEMADSFLSDYARFDVLVDEVLVGNPPRTITATWDNSTFDEPKTMPGGRYLLALRRAASQAPPLRGPSGTILPTPAAGLFTVVQAPCAPAFIFRDDSAQATAVRQVLGAR